MTRAEFLRDQYRRLAINFERWIGICIAAGEIEANAHRSQMFYLQNRRDRLVKEIVRASEHPAIFFNHRYFRHCQRAVISSDEAVIELRRLIVKNRMKRGHWSYNPGLIPQLQEAMVFARYFRRFGRRIWSLDRAAAVRQNEKDVA